MPGKQFGEHLDIAPEVAGALSKVTPAARMSWRKIRPNWSSRTLPKKAERPPRAAIPTMVFAADPPDISSAGPIAS